MKITAWHEPPPSNIEVSVSIDDVVSLLNEAPDSQASAINLAVAASQAFKAISDERIAAMKPAQRLVISEMLTAQSARFTAP